MADDLTIYGKNLAQHKASSAVLMAVMGRLIVILETDNSSLTAKVDEMFSLIIQQMNAARDKLTQPPSAIELYFFEQYSKEISHIQNIRNALKTQAESRLKEDSPPEA